MLLFLISCLCLYSNPAAPATAAATNSSNTSSSGSSSYPPDPVAVHDERLTLSRDIIAEMSIRELKSVMQAYAVDCAGCLEKSDMVRRLQDSGLVCILE